MATLARREGLRVEVQSMAPAPDTTPNPSSAPTPAYIFFPGTGSDPSPPTSLLKLLSLLPYQVEPLDLADTASVKQLTDKLLGSLDR